MAYHSFPLFQSHLDLAHSYWEQLVEQGDCVIDATCGNGHDTLKLAALSLTADKGTLWSFDIQCQAVEHTRSLLAASLGAQEMCRAHIIQHSHTSFPKTISEGSVKLIVYNLGYLPGGDKTITTCVDSTLQSIQAARKLIAPGGAICVTCYPGHTEGAREQDCVFDLVKEWPPQTWSVALHQWLNRRKAPSLLLIQRNSADSDSSSAG